ncbi:MAG: DUF1588 domain-containing protein, partial [Deltaproteobacteria bacterium]|nr:DUF1588 domain-containing protein [Nannocystaceae bacterium]
MVNRRGYVALLAFALGGCAESDETAPDDALAPAAVLARASLDVRGRRPSIDELDAIAADPQQLDAMIDGFVDDPAFAGRVAEIFAGAWRTRIDDYPLPEGAYDDEASAKLSAAIGEEPLSLLAFIADNDLPYTQLVRSTETFVDPALLELWPLVELPDDGTTPPTGLVRARYSDGRPLAGVLTHNAVFWRHPSTVENANRGRANALSQALLCQSYLDRPIDFPSDLDLTDSESIRNAIATNVACQGCHSTMDPLASYFWGFMYGEPDEPGASYAVELERAWQLYTGAAPAFFGVPGERMEELADHLADDERFIGCAVRRVYQGLLGREPSLDDEGALADHREAFLDGDLTLRALVRSVLRDPSYRGRAWTPRFGGAPEPVMRKVSPVDVIARSIATLSGYALTHQGRPASRLDDSLRAIAGGSDRGDTDDVSTGAVLVQRRLAEAGAIHAFDAAIAGEDGGGTLAPWLASVDLGGAPSPDDLARLARITRSQTLAPDDPELVALGQVWTDVAAIADVRQ